MISNWPLAKLELDGYTIQFRTLRFASLECPSAQQSSRKEHGARTATNSFELLTSLLSGIAPIWLLAKERANMWERQQRENETATRLDIKGREYRRGLFFIIQGFFFSLKYIQIYTKSSPKSPLLVQF